MSQNQYLKNVWIIVLLNENWASILNWYSAFFDFCFQINIPAPDSKDDDSDEMDIGQLRMAATTTANKAHSWRGDHPMKNPATGHYHPIMTAQPVGPHHHAQPINHHQHTVRKHFFG